MASKKEIEALGLKLAGICIILNGFYLTVNTSKWYISSVDIPAKTMIGWAGVIIFSALFLALGIGVIKRQRIALFLGLLFLIIASLYGVFYYKDFWRSFIDFSLLAYIGTSIFGEIVRGDYKNMFRKKS